VTGLN